MTTQAYAPLTHAQQVFKDLVWTPMVKVGETYLEGQVPFLALPIVKQLDEATIEAIAEWAFSQLVMVMDVTAIKLVNSAHQSAYDNASLKLKIVLIESGAESDEYKKARDVAALALSKFTRFGS